MASWLHFAGLAVTAQILGHPISKTIPPQWFQREVDNLGNSSGSDSNMW